MSEGRREEGKTKGQKRERGKEEHRRKREERKGKTVRKEGRMRRDREPPSHPSVTVIGTFVCFTLKTPHVGDSIEHLSFSDLFR